VLSTNLPYHEYAGHGNENEPGLKNALITKTCLDFAVDLPMPANTIIDGAQLAYFAPIKSQFTIAPEICIPHIPNAVHI